MNRFQTLLSTAACDPTQWRTKIATNSREWEERNRALRNEKEIMSRHYQELKAGQHPRLVAPSVPGYTRRIPGWLLLVYPGTLAASSSALPVS